MASSEIPCYGQLVIGSPGAGKSTYCAGLAQLFKQLKRPTVFVNLDPANDSLPFKADVDIRELISVGDAMGELGLGPNGAMLYCMKTLVENAGWLKSRLRRFPDHYILLDMPGQLELYNSDDSIVALMAEFRKWGWRMCAVHLTDCTYVSDPGKFISVVLTALSIMVNLEVAQVNVLSKVDLMPSDAPYSLDFYENLPDMSPVAELLEDNPALAKYKGMSRELCEVIDSYGLVNFTFLDVTSKDRMLSLLKSVDNANGFSIADAADLTSTVGR